MQEHIEQVMRKRGGNQIKDFVPLTKPLDNAKPSIKARRLFGLLKKKYVEIKSSLGQI